MQKIIEFKSKNFWSSQVDINSLNNKISELNKDGWVIKSIIPNTTLFGAVISYTLMIELSV
ncbi:DUF4177 domain-containing protein [Colwelliaceae bacterium BS250]